ncbi:hypothetical protein C8Q74DRAFT_1209393 [Fomes fomentarius]|nr:hypothetical protein C8Q74DRAFT_1209393 [Fomes fomentarius]
MSSVDTSNVTTPPNTAPETARSSKSGKKPVTLPKALVPHAAKAKPVGKRLTAAQKKKKMPMYTPSEYAKVIQAEFAEKMQKGIPPKYRALKGKRIFFSGGDYSAAVESTRGKMNIIVKNSGEIIGDYDAQKITHIVTSDDVGSRALLSTIGVKKLSDIPEHIPIVTWKWVLDTLDIYEDKLKTTGGVGTGEDKIEVYTGREHMFAVFSERLDASKTPQGKSSIKQPPKGHRAKDLISDSEDEVDQDEIARTFSKADAAAGLPSPPSSPAFTGPDAQLATVSRASSDVLSSSSGAAAATTTEDDPLAEFYPLARLEQFQEMYFGEDDGSDGDQESIATSKNESVDRLQGGSRHKKGQKKGVRSFLCDDKGAHARPDTGFNKLIIDKLMELRDIHTMKGMEGDFFRVLNLNKAIASLRKCGPITNAQQASGLPGIGKKTVQKIAEILGTGELQRIKWELTDDLKIKRKFAIIHDVGIKTATVWYNRGCRTLEDVIAGKGGIRLSDSQKIGLKYYHELQERIPRSEVQEIYDTILDIALSFDPNLYMRVMGSFRRGKADCGDIDILITRPTNDGKTHRGILRRLLAELHRRGILTDDLTVPKDWNSLEQKYNGICRKDPQSLHRRIDFLTMPWKSRGGALLYFTGDDIFNRSLRLKANKMGYSLNQRGLYAGVIRDPNDRKKKLHEGTLIASETEQEIFRILGVPWQEPHERVRS